MLASSAMLGLNLIPQRSGLVDATLFYKSFDHTDGVHTVLLARHYISGWPYPGLRRQSMDWVQKTPSDTPQGFRLQRVFQSSDLATYLGTLDKDTKVVWWEIGTWRDIGRLWTPKHVAINVLIAFGVVMLSAMVCEVICRRRDSRQKLS